MERPHLKRNMRSEHLSAQFSKIAFRRMEQEARAEFAQLRLFRTPLTEKFLRWIETVPVSERLEAALSLPARMLSFRRFPMPLDIAFQKWFPLFSDFPTSPSMWNSGQRHESVTRILENLGAQKVQNAAFYRLPSDNQFHSKSLETWIVVHSRFVDLQINQSLIDDNNRTEISYLASIGLGATGWRLAEADGDNVVPHIRAIVAKGREFLPLS